MGFSGSPSLNLQGVTSTVYIIISLGSFDVKTTTATKQRMLEDAIMLLLLTALSLACHAALSGLALVGLFTNTVLSLQSTGGY